MSLCGSTLVLAVLPFFGDATWVRAFGNGVRHARPAVTKDIDAANFHKNSIVKRAVTIGVTPKVTRRVGTVNRNHTSAPNGAAHHHYVAVDEKHLMNVTVAIKTPINNRITARAKATYPGESMTAVLHEKNATELEHFTEQIEARIGNSVKSASLDKEQPPSATKNLAALQAEAIRIVKVNSTPQAVVENATALEDWIEASLRNASEIEARMVALNASSFDFDGEHRGAAVVKNVSKQDEVKDLPALKNASTLEAWIAASLKNASAIEARMVALDDNISTPKVKQVLPVNTATPSKEHDIPVLKNDSTLEEWINASLKNASAMEARMVAVNNSNLEVWPTLPTKPAIARKAATLNRPQNTSKIVSEPLLRNHTKSDKLTVQAATLDRPQNTSKIVSEPLLRNHTKSDKLAVQAATLNRPQNTSKIVSEPLLRNHTKSDKLTVQAATLDRPQNTSKIVSEPLLRNHTKSDKLTVQGKKHALGGNASKVQSQPPAKVIKNVSKLIIRAEGQAVVVNTSTAHVKAHNKTDDIDTSPLDAFLNKSTAQKTPALQNSSALEAWIAGSLKNASNMKGRMASLENTTVSEAQSSSTLVNQSTRKAQSSSTLVNQSTRKEPNAKPLPARILARPLFKGQKHMSISRNTSAAQAHLHSNHSAFKNTSVLRNVSPAPGAWMTKAVAPPLIGQLAAFKSYIFGSSEFTVETARMSLALGCMTVRKPESCERYVREAAFCLAFASQLDRFTNITGKNEEQEYCEHIDERLPQLSLFLQGRGKGWKLRLLQISDNLHQLSSAPEDDLAQEMTHDLEMNFNKIAPFGKEDTAKELQDHAAKTQDTLVDAVENAEVAEIKRAVFRALTRLRAATIKEFDTIARLETQAIDAYNDAHHYRAENPLAHLHEDEAPVETDKLKSFH